MDKIKVITVVVSLFVGLTAGMIGFILGCSANYEKLGQTNKEISDGVANSTKGQEYVVATPDQEAHSIVWTNIGPGSFQQAEQVLAIPLNMPIYDLAYTKYSASYAEKYGYPDSHVIDLPKKVHLLEATMRTIGKKLQCHLNILIEKDLGLDLPENAYVTQLEISSKDFIKINRPERLKNWVEPPHLAEHRLNYLTTSSLSLTNEKFKLRNAAISTQYEQRGQEVIAQEPTSVEIREYNPWFYPDLDYISLNIACGPIGIHMFKEPSYYVWLKRKSGRDYSKIINMQAEDFFIFDVPNEFRQEIAGYLRTIRMPLYPSSN